MKNLKREIIVVCVACGLLFIIGVARNLPDPNPAVVRATNTALAAARAANQSNWAVAGICQKFVTERLKAPATADFQSNGDADVRNMGGGKYRVFSFVDSQNSFGANIRTKFGCY